MHPTLALITLVSSLSLARPAQAAPSPLKPGLWEISIKFSRGDGGPEIDLQAQMKEAMAHMSPEQKKKMMEMMAKSGANVDLSGPGGSRVCYTQQSLTSPSDLVAAAAKKQQCTTTLKEHTDKHVLMDFQCKDGGTGTGEWTLTSPTSYTMTMNFNRGPKKGMMKMNGHFVSKDCGAVKPLRTHGPS